MRLHSFHTKRRVTRLSILSLLVTALSLLFSSQAVAQCLVNPTGETAVGLSNASSYFLTFYIDRVNQGGVPSGDRSVDFVVSPGEHALRADAVIGGQTVSASRTATLSAGYVCTWTVTNPPPAPSSSQSDSSSVRASAVAPAVVPPVRLSDSFIPAPERNAMSARTVAQTTKSIEFDRYDSSYFSLAQVGPKVRTNYLVITNRTEFDKAFHPAAVMGNQNKFIPDDQFKTKLFVATVKVGGSLRTFSDINATASRATLRVSYSAQDGEPGSAVYKSPLILAVDNRKYSRVVFIENGQRVRTISLKGKRARRKT